MAAGCPEQVVTPSPLSAPLAPRSRPLTRRRGLPAVLARPAAPRPRSSRRSARSTMPPVRSLRARNRSTPARSRAYPRLSPRRMRLLSVQLCLVNRLRDRSRSPVSAARRPSPRPLIAGVVAEVLRQPMLAAARQAVRSTARPRRWTSSALMSPSPSRRRRASRSSCCSASARAASKQQQQHQQ